MSPLRRLAGFTWLLLLLGTTVWWITQESLRPHESNQERGLRWLKEEYQLEDATFDRVRNLHAAYFARCDKMCQQIKEASRPLLMRSRLPAANAAGLRQHEQQLCDQCEAAARRHLHEVARLMPPAQGQRFLDDMLTTLEAQRLQHNLETFGTRTRQ